MFDPFLEVSRLVDPLRRASAFTDAWASSPWAAAAVVLSFGLSLAGLSLTAAGRGFSVFVHLGNYMAVIAVLLLAAGPSLRFLERSRLSRLRLFSGSYGDIGAYGRIREVPMSVVVRAFALTQPSSFSQGPPRSYCRPEALDEAHTIVAKRMLRALELQPAGDRLLAVMATLANRVEVLSDPSVPASVLLDSLDRLPSRRSGLSQGIARMLAEEVWEPVFGVAYRRVASDLAGALLKVSAMSDSQVDSLRAFMQASWSGSVGDLLEVAEHVGS